MKNCFLCESETTLQQAMEWGKIYDALDLHCSECGVYRISNFLLTSNAMSESFKKECSKILKERNDKEKRRIYFVTSNGVKPQE